MASNGNGNSVPNGGAPLNGQHAEENTIKANVHRKLLQRMLLGSRDHFILLPAILHQKVRGQRKPSCGGADHVAEVAETIVITLAGIGGSICSPSQLIRSGMRDG